MKSTTEVKFNKLIQDLQSVYGVDAVISRKQLMEVYNKNKQEYASYTHITLNPIYNFGRSQFCITKDVTRLTELKNQHDEKQKTLKDPVALVKKVFPDVVKKAKTPVAKKKTQEKSVEQNTLVSYNDDFITQHDVNESFGGNDINDILRTIQN